MLRHRPKPDEPEPKQGPNALRRTMPFNILLQRIEYATNLSQINPVIFEISRAFGFVPTDHLLIVGTKNGLCQTCCA